jgi:hypothetical protein
MSIKKTVYVIILFCFCFGLGIIVSAYDYNIAYVDGYNNPPAPMRQYADFAIETKCSICAAAETWTVLGDLELVYTTVDDHNITESPYLNDYNDISKDIEGSEAALAQTFVIQQNLLETAIIEADIEFNISYPFGDATINTSVYDIQSIMLHEFGHLLGLDNVDYNSNPVMYQGVSLGATKRNLTIDDILGIDQIY